MSNSNKKVKKYIYLILFSITITAIFLGIDYAEIFPLSPHAKFDSCTNIWQNLRGIDWPPSVVVGIYTLIVGILYINLNNVKAIFLEFIVPLAIVIFTLISGTYGFLKTDCYNFGDSFFASANLLTLNTSVFKSFLAEHHNEVNFWIENARLMGGIFLTYAFVLALSLATGKENISRILFWWFRKWNGIKNFVFKPFEKVKNLLVASDNKFVDKIRAFLSARSFKFFKKTSFSVVIGDGEKAVSLALNLEKDGQRVAFLHQGFGEYTESIIEETDIWYLKGNASSQTGLEKTHFQLAEKVYVLNDSDDENFRTVQEMEEILKQKEDRAKWFLNLIKKILRQKEDRVKWFVNLIEKILKQKESKAKWFVHLTDLRKKSLLTTFISRYIQTFDINQNIARRLINKNPINRFENGSTVAQVVIVGFGQLAEAIVIQCLRIGHFTGKRHLQIKVYFTEKDQENVNHFKQTHPELFKFQGIYGENNFASVQHYAFFQHSETLIDFEEIPLAESALINPNFSLYSLIKPKNCVTLYACLDGGIDNAAFMGTVLPRMTWKKQEDCNNDVEVYCQYNFPDLKEKKVIENKLKELTSNQVKILCFGSYLEECTDENIENKELDLLAKQIGKLYAKIYDKLKYEKDNDLKIAYAKELLKDWKTDDLDTIWEADKEINRESNRQAADHAKIKFSLLNLSDENLPESYQERISFWSNESLEALGELEHRRWCAEKLLLGWLPTYVHIDEWYAKKSQYQKQKLHQHLVPFDALDESEKNKDYTQVLGLPFFVKNLKG